MSWLNLPDMGQSRRRLSSRGTASTSSTATISSFHSESSPLEVDSVNRSRYASIPTYPSSATFTTVATPPFSHSRKQQQQHKQQETWTMLISPFLLFITASSSAGSPPPSRLKPSHAHSSSSSSSSFLRHAWRIAVGVAVCLVVVLYRAYYPPQPQYYASPKQWHWDRNVYIPPPLPRTSPHNNVADRHDDVTTTTADNGQEPRLALVAHLGGASPGLQEIMWITSRPNRAYARQWKMDYVQYVSMTDSGGSATSNSRVGSVVSAANSITSKAYAVARHCFDKVWVLNAILDNQNRLQHNNDHRGGSPSVKYHVLILLPPDAVMTNLDYDLLQWLPRDKLAAIAGWPNNENADANLLRHSKDPPPHTFHSRSDVILFNLQHPLAAAVAELWWEMVQPDEITCGANNDLAMLVSTIVAVLEQEKHQDIVLDDLLEIIEPLQEDDNGFVGEDPQINHVLKCLAPSVPGSRSLMLLTNFEAHKVTLQATADSVCYRYYPKCEVL